MKKLILLFILILFACQTKDHRQESDLVIIQDTGIFETIYVTPYSPYDSCDCKEAIDILKEEIADLYFQVRIRDSIIGRIFLYGN